MCLWFVMLRVILDESVIYQVEAQHASTMTCVHACACRDKIVLLSIFVAGAR